MCENIVAFEGEIPAASMAKLLKYIVLKRRIQDLAEIEDVAKVLVYLQCIHIITSASRLDRHRISCTGQWHR